MYLYYFKIGILLKYIYSFTIHFYVLEVNIDTKISHLLNYVPIYLRSNVSPSVSISIRSLPPRPIKLARNQAPTRRHRSPGNKCFLLKIARIVREKLNAALLNIGFQIIKENTSEIGRWWLAAHREGWANLDGYQGKRYVK